MDIVNITLENGILKEVYGIFYLYNSKYYFIYTENEVDENGYTVLHLVQVGKEIVNTQSGKVDTGNMVGIEVADSNEWRIVQDSITKIVDDKKNNTQNPDIQYLPINMLVNLKIMNKKTFRLMKNVVEGWLKSNQQNENIINENSNANLPFESVNQTDNLIQNVPSENLYGNMQNTNFDQNNFNSQQTNWETQSDYSQGYSQGYSQDTTNNMTQQSDVIIDYRSSFFEEQAKNQQLQMEIDELNQKLLKIKEIIE